MTERVVTETALLREPDFLKLWTGQAISHIGSSITSIGLPLVAVLMLHASPLEMGFLGGASAASVLLFGLFAGAWADRLRRRPILIAADLGRAVVIGSVPLAAVLHRLTMAHLCLVAAVGAMLTVLFDVSYQAYLPSLVESGKLGDANSKLALTESFAEVAGPGITGILIQAITAPIAILFDAFSFLCSAISVWLIRKPEPPPVRELEPDMGREIREGLLVSWREPVLRALAARAAWAAFFLGFGASLYFLFAVGELGLSAGTVGLIISVGGALNLLGAALAERIARRFGPGRALIGSSLLTGAAALVVPLAHGPALLAVAQLGDLGWPLYNITERSLRQKIVPNHLLGRVNSAMHLLFHGLIPLGALAGGVLAESIGVRAAVAIGALGFLLSTLCLLGAPVRRLMSS
jgi:predicted MFS family arabinose efflux permease